MSYGTERITDINLTKSGYDAIIEKLLTTSTKHKAIFPQLTAIEAYLDDNFTETDTEYEQLEKLDVLCLHFKELSVSCYVFRHLYYNLCGDVEAVKNRTATFNQHESYITLPR